MSHPFIPFPAIPGREVPLADLQIETLQVAPVRIGPGQCPDPVSIPDQFPYQACAYETGRTGDKNIHNFIIAQKQESAEAKLF